MSKIEYEPQRPSYQELLAAFAQARECCEHDPSPHQFELLEAGLDLLVAEFAKPGRFALGQLVMTRGAEQTLAVAHQHPLEFLLRHQNLDWGELPPEDVRENAWALEHGARLFSRYTTRLDEALYVITEWDRSVTTMLRPEEY